MNIINQISFIKNYKFTYTEQDVYNFNESYFKNFGVRPFTDTTKKESMFNNVDINTTNIKRFLNYSLDSYDDVNDFDDSILVQSGNSQAMIYNNDDDDEVIISFRGTETDSQREMFLGKIPKDIITDFKSDIELASTLGWLGINEIEEDIMIHKGFNDYVDVIYNDIVENHIINNTNKKIYICGHSLGGISAQIFSYRLFLDMKSQGININIEGVYAYGGVKGMYSPYNNIDNNINIYNIFHFLDPVPYWFPIFGDCLGVKLILYQNSDYEIYYKDQLIPYLGISINDSNDYFDRLVKDPSYIGQKRSSWVGYISGISRDIFETTDTGKYFRDMVGSTIKYPTGRYSLAISLSSNILEHKGDTGYNISVKNLQDDVYISKKKGFSDIIDKQDPLFESDKLSSSISNSSNSSSISDISNNSKQIKPLGYIMNYNSSMNNHKIIF